MKNWAGIVTFQDSQTFAPATVEEMARIVSKEPKVRARGSAHCFNSIADTDAISVTFENMPQGIVIDKDREIVNVPAGMKYGALAVALHDRGWAIHNMASLLL